MKVTFVKPTSCVYLDGGFSLALKAAYKEWYVKQTAYTSMIQEHHPAIVRKELFSAAKSGR